MPYFVNSTNFGSSSNASLLEELKSLEGLHKQNPENGSKLNDTLMSQYTNRVFGMPYQLMDNVDRRFPSINKYVGNEYLRNFVLNSPILHIKPGMPKYTGGNDSDGLADSLKSIYMDSNVGDMSLVESLLTQMSKSTIFKKGSKLQRRMFGFRETYYDYMQHVNYMCRSAAIFMKLTTGEEFPDGTFTSEGYSRFVNMDWENYRMLADSTPLNPWEYFSEMVKVGEKSASAVATTLGWDFTKLLESNFGLLDEAQESITGESAIGAIKNIFNLNDSDLEKTWAEANQSSFASVLTNKTASVQFMVEPSEFTEVLTNSTKNSVVEDTVDSLRSSVGSELQFITGSNADIGVLDDVLGVLGDTASAAVTKISSLVSNVTGGFMHNVFSGAIQSIKGQKMIYPKIYDSSNSQADYEFDVTLESPYGDAYNYYMNIVVPLCHLIASASPRMVTANTTTSPYLVQAYIPGMVTCQMGIIQNMSITKNPSQTHVSVDGFPLSVKVHFTIEELYNAMSISPANDPASFLFNETLNDYLANLSGLIPSVDTYTQQRSSMFSSLRNYFGQGEWINDILSPYNESIENIINPFY